MSSCTRLVIRQLAPALACRMSTSYRALDSRLSPCHSTLLISRVGRRPLATWTPQSRRPLARPLRMARPSRLGFTPSITIALCSFGRGSCHQQCRAATHGSCHRLLLLSADILDVILSSPETFPVHLIWFRSQEAKHLVPGRTNLPSHRSVLRETISGNKQALLLLTIHFPLSFYAQGSGANM